MTSADDMPASEANDALTAPAQASFDAGERADQSTKSVLLHLLDSLESHLPGVLEDADPECLHDFRIAVRRSRSALSQTKGVFPDKAMLRFAHRLAWLGEISGTARDLDVYLSDFDGLQQTLPETLRDSLEPLRGYIKTRRDLAHTELRKQLQSQRFRTLMASWRKFLAAPCPSKPNATLAMQPIKDVANRRIWKLFRRAARQGRAVAPDSPAESLHELRKTLKKLRYLLEFSRELHPEGELDRLIRRLKQLQNHLGEFQDTHTRIAVLEELCLTMRQDPDVPTAALLAAGGLLASLSRRQARLRRSFPKHFKPFSRPRNRARFRTLFKSEPLTNDQPPTEG